MGKLLRFPARNHRIAPTVTSTSFDRAASKAIVLAVTPAVRARLVRKMEHHHSGGMKSRCHHFETFQAVTRASSMSDAMPAREGPQSSMIERNDVIRGNGVPRRARSDRDDLILPITESPLGQYVLTHKVNVSRESVGLPVENTGMGKGTKSNFKAEFTARVKKARQGAGYSQTQMAELLDIDQGKYKQYEGRSYMPHDLLPRFVLLCRVDAGWLFTGNVRGARVEDIQNHRPPRSGRRDKVA